MVICMMISNKKVEFGRYQSLLRDYLYEKFNYDDSHLIYSEKYGVPSFSITKPNYNYKNCDFINGYPCIKEIESFINHSTLYKKNFTIRYGDLHPNKPIPMLGQLRNVVLSDVFTKMLRTSGKVNNVFTIGDISEKTIKFFIDKYGYNDEKNIFTFLLNSIFSNENSNNEYVQKYMNFCNDSLNETKLFFEKLLFYDFNYLFESQLYFNQKLYSKIKKLQCDNGIKSNGNIKYALQEFMFLLNGEYIDSNIVNIIGLDQSEHIRNVLSIMERNNINNNVYFLTYGICKNAGSRNIDEWSKEISSMIEKKNLTINNNSINYLDFLKFAIVSSNNDCILDFGDLNWFNKKYIEEIAISLINAKEELKSSSVTIKSNSLLNQMSLVNQTYDNAITNGNPSKILKYLYSLSKEFNSNKVQYSEMSSLYYDFVARNLELLSIDKTETFQKVLKRGK